MPILAKAKSCLRRIPNPFRKKYLSNQEVDRLRAGFYRALRKAEPGKTEATYKRLLFGLSAEVSLKQMGITDIEKTRKIISLAQSFAGRMDILEEAGKDASGGDALLKDLMFKSFPNELGGKQAVAFYLKFVKNIKTLGNMFPPI